MLRLLLFAVFIIIIIFVTTYIIAPFISQKYEDYKEKKKQKELKNQKQEENDKPIGFTISK